MGKLKIKKPAEQDLHYFQIKGIEFCKCYAPTAFWVHLLGTAFEITIDGVPGTVSHNYFCLFIVVYTIDDTVKPVLSGHSK